MSLNPKNPLEHNAGADWLLRHSNPVRRFLRRLEALTLSLEAPLAKWVRRPEFNPLYHTGTLAVFFSLLILVTGVYLTLFYPFGFEASYQAVARMEANFIGRLMRALHRYASGALLITALLHGYRTFFMDRFRGARWLAWVSGVFMTAAVWLIGVTGYWLIWDERAGWINQTLVRLLQGWPAGVSFLLQYLVTERAGAGWVFVLLVISLHLGLSALVGLFLWLHLKRLNRPKLFPPRFWLWAALGLLFIAALFFPVGMLPPIRPGALPGQVPLDGLFLFYLPLALYDSPLALWAGLTLALGLLTAIPWLLPRRPLPPVSIDPQRCTGCTLCAEDCPYGALRMIPRQDQSGYKHLAQLDPRRCVACGICLGSCQPLAISLDRLPPEDLWQKTLSQIKSRADSPLRLVFACERHALHGARPWLTDQQNRPDVLIVPLTCMGMLPPDLVLRSLEAGAAEIHLVGCPPEDCANREGNLWLQDRLERRRPPRLHQDLQKLPVSFHWLPPNQFDRALQPRSEKSQASAYRLKLSRQQWLGFLPALLLLALALGLQLALGNLPYRPALVDQAQVEIILQHHSGFPLQGFDRPAQPNLDLPTRLLLEVDGRAVWDQTIPLAGSGGRRLSTVYEQIPLPPGAYHLRLLLFDRPEADPALVLFNEQVTLEKGQILRLEYQDARPKGDPRLGERLFSGAVLGANPGCAVCHSLEPGVDLVGPSLAGVASRAAQRVPGLSAEEYLRQSLLEPDAFVVEGFPAGLMVPDLQQRLTPEQIEDLLAFLLTLK